MNERKCINCGVQMKKTDVFKSIDEEIKRKGIKFTREEAVRDDLYN